jgi:hypothetical protein
MNKNQFCNQQPSAIPKLPERGQDKCEYYGAISISKHELSVLTNTQGLQFIPRNQYGRGKYISIRTHILILFWHKRSMDKLCYLYNFDFFIQQYSNITTKTLNVLRQFNQARKELELRFKLRLNGLHRYKSLWRGYKTPYPIVCLTWALASGRARHVPQKEVFAVKEEHRRIIRNVTATCYCNGVVRYGIQY